MAAELKDVTKFVKNVSQRKGSKKSALISFEPIANRLDD